MTQRSFIQQQDIILHYSDHIKYGQGDTHIVHDLELLLCDIDSVLECEHIVIDQSGRVRQPNLEEAHLKSTVDASKTFIAQPEGSTVR